MKQFSILFAAAALTLASGLATAQPTGDNNSAGGGRGMIRQACAADFQKFCPDAKPGPGGGMRECIVGHQADFSDGCKSAIAQMRAAMQARQGGGASSAPGASQ